MSHHAESYSYQHGSGAPARHLATSYSTHLRRRSLRFGVAIEQQNPLLQPNFINKILDDETEDFALALVPSQPLDTSSNYSNDSLPESPLKNRHSHYPKTPARRKQHTTRGTVSKVISPTKRTSNRPRRSGGRANNVPVISIQESIQGFGPPPARHANGTTQPGSLLQRDPSGQRKGASNWWRFVYGLSSESQPDSYTLDGIPVLTKKPQNTPWIGCRVCNTPVPPATRSMYVIILNSHKYN
jgi:hypothetical protein